MTSVFPVQHFKKEQHVYEIEDEIFRKDAAMHKADFPKKIATE